ncbi:VP33B protein, partial [Leptocoma aspasia]|nr:VP33B protein [Leptocoma aspasia]
MSPAMNGPSTCCPWMKTSLAWSCPSSSVITFWSVGHRGEVTAHPVPCASPGLGTRCCSERRCVASCSALVCTMGPLYCPGAAFVGEWWLGPELTLWPWLSSFGVSRCVLGCSSQPSSPCRGSPPQPAAHSHCSVPQEGDHRWINPVARALQLLNSLYGPFGKTYGIGRCAKMIYELWRDLEEESETEGQGRRPEIGHIFLMDRDTDYVTALCSQVVYEGLVDDTFRIKCGSVDFGPDVTSSDKSIKVLLNSQDKVFSQIRNEHFSSVFGFLSQKSRNLQAQYDRRRGMDIKQMKDFVSQELKGLKQEHRLLSLHIGACESIMKKKTKQDFQETIKAEHSLLEGFDIRESTSFIEEHIDRQVSPVESLRLMCLLSITENGLVPKDYRSLKSQYLQSYGPEHLLTFHNLKRMGLLTEQSAGETLTAMESKVSKLVTDRAAGKITDAFNSLARKSNFRAISKKLGLIPRLDGEYDLKMPRDMAYVFGGSYVPLSCKIIEQVLERRGWQGLEEVVRLLSGSEFSFSGTGGLGAAGLAAGSAYSPLPYPDSAGEDSPAGDSQRVVLAVFLGGCTFSEIAALRFLGKERG